MTMKMNLFHLAILITLIVQGIGCTTTRTSETSRTGMEQLLLSNAVDQSLNKLNFAGLRGQSVYLDDQFLECVDKGYVLGSVRQRVLNVGGRLVAKPEESDVVLEVRSGGIGTDNVESYVGMPGIALPGPMPVELPEVKLWNRVSQMGTAKIGVVAYDTRGRYLLNHGGHAMARADDNNWFILGVGPFQNGTVREEIQVATQRFANPMELTERVQMYDTRTVANTNPAQPQNSVYPVSAVERLPQTARADNTNTHLRF